MSRKRKCPQCAGLGFGISFPGGEVECPWCKGSGRVTPSTAEAFKRAKAGAARLQPHFDHFLKKDREQG